MTAKITSLAPWFGAKRTLAPEVIKALGPHRSYWEPFCGSMAVLLAKPRAASETVCDLHGDIMNLALVLQCEYLGPWLYRHLRRTLLHESIFDEAAEMLAQETPPAGTWEGADNHRAWAFFVCSWMGRNGTAGTPGYNANFCVRYSNTGGSPAKRWQAAVDSIPAWRERMRGVTILRRDAFAVLERIADERGTAIYLDPPYIAKGAKYEHDFTDDDHRRLAELAGRFRKARVVVSYYDHPTVRALYTDGWAHREIPVRRSLAAASKRGENDSRAVELLITNDGPRTGRASVPTGLFATTEAAS